MCWEGAVAGGAPSEPGAGAHPGAGPPWSARILAPRVRAPQLRAPAAGPARV